jgi:pimeloyl-ACP methyl ester carboxylesterase
MVALGLLPGLTRGQSQEKQRVEPRGSKVIRARKITTRGLTFDALETGSSGEPVLLLHGFPETSLMWTGLMPVLSAKLRGLGALGLRRRRDGSLSCDARDLDD